MKKEGNLFVSSLRPPDCAAIRLGEIFPKTVKVVATLHNIPAGRLNAEGPLPDYSVVVYGENRAKRVIMGLIAGMKALIPLDRGPLELAS